MKTKHFVFILISLLIVLSGLVFSCNTPTPVNPGEENNIYSGTLDIAFDSDGIVTTDIANSNNSANSVAIQSDGKIVIAGHTDNGNNEDMAIIRYNSNGTLDTTFGGTGIFTLDIDNDNANDYGNSVAMQNDGKIVVAGSSGINVAVVRYNSNGTLDTTFGVNGTVTTNNANSSYGYSLAIQNDGKIVVVGNIYDGSNYNFAVFRYNDNGTLDNTFDGDGIVIKDIGGNNDEAYSVAIQSDGKIVVAGYTDNGNDKNIAIVRYNSNGTLDTTFDSDGIITKDISGDDKANSIKIQSDGKIVVAGYSANKIAVVRYNSDGTLDTTFDYDGTVTTIIGNSAYASSVAIQSDGKIVVAGFNNDGSNDKIAIVRYNSNGTLDTTFGGTGFVTKDIGGYADQANSLAIQGDGNIVVVGYTENTNNKDILVVRYIK